MSAITGVHGREVFDSRGNPTVEVEVELASGITGRAIVPSGASTGRREALEMRDLRRRRFGGRGVLQAVAHVNNELAVAVIGIDVIRQIEVDRLMIALDGTAGKKRLGANAVLGVSLAVAKAAAREIGLPLYSYIGGAGAHKLPLPQMNVLNGGVHADNNVDIQEFMIVPVGAKSFARAMRMGVETYHALKAVLKERGYRTSVGDEGGFAPDLESNEEAMEILMAAIVAAGYEPGADIAIAIDAAASEFYDSRRRVYMLTAESEPEKDVDALIAFYDDWLTRYPLVSIEDPLAEGDWRGWGKLCRALGGKVQLVGDDIFVTNTGLLARGIKEKSANSILIKPNQIGTLTETMDAVAMAHQAGFTAVISHRSGETEDTTIADLSVALDSGQIKAGAPCRTDRVAKYNQLLRIEEDLGGAAVFAGRRAVIGLEKDN